MPDNLLLSAMKLFLALPVVILLAYISLRLSDKFLYKQNTPKEIQILERIPIHNKQFLCIVQIFGTYMVMGVSENNFQPIKTLNPEEVKVYLAQKEQADTLHKWRYHIIQWTKREKQHD